MKLSRRHFLQLATGAAALATASCIAWAQTYPTAPVRVIVPFGPGGPSDVIGRLIAQKLSEHLGRQFFVENIAGAGSNVGMGRAARAVADGYTILVVAPNYVVNPALYEKVPYDPIKDFDPITVAVKTTVVLTVNPSLPVQTMKNLVALIRANPAKYSYASGGIGTPGHLVGEQFRLSLGLDLVHVPYNSAGLAIGSAVAGHTPISFVAPAPAVPQIKDGKLRALAVTSKTRSLALPDVATMTEAGYPDIEFDNWFAVLAPARTPRAIISLLNREIVKIVMLPDVKERLATLGFEPVGNTPEQFASQIRTETAKWARIISAAGIKAE
jgi:tripartite-type tricarboxylate transporter receptor subunit TctC